MRAKLIAIIFVALLSALAIPVYHSAAKAAPSPAMPAAVPDNHPEYHDALDALRNARKHLEKAEADGYGHRDAAIRAVDEAIHHCDQALAALH